jgi:hypothetical protein
MLADFITLERPPHSVWREIDPSYLVYGYSACDVTNVVVGGKTVITR